MTSIDGGAGSERPARRPSGPHPDVERLRLRDGLELSIRVSGLGRPVVLLHGFTGSGRAWGAAVPGLARGGRGVIVPDLIGHGESSRPYEPARYRCRNVVRDVAEVLHLAGGGVEVGAAVDLVGYSMGARVALAVGLAHPERVRRLVLESGSPGLRDPGDRRRRRSADAALATMLREKGLAPFLEHWRDLPIFATLRARLGAEGWAAVEAQRSTNDPLALAAALEGLGTGAQPSFWDDLGTLACPTLVLTGTLDPKFTTIGRAMARRMPVAEHRVVPGAGHRIHLEDPDRWLSAVQGFLS